MNLASESWIDGWPLWARLLAFLVAVPTILVTFALVVTFVCGGGDRR